MRKWTIALALITASISFSAKASTVSAVYVTSILPNASGTVYFTHTSTRSGVPSCGAINANRFAFDATTPGGQVMLSTLLTAFAAHKPLSIVGSTTCAAPVSDTEGVSYFTVTE